MSTRTQVTLAGKVVWGVVSMGTSSVAACEVGVWPELCSSAGDSGVVGAAVGLVVVSVELWLVLMEVEETSAGEVGRGEGDEAGVWGEVTAGDSAGDCDPVAGTLASGVPELCSVGVGVKWTSLFVDKGSVFVPSQVEVGLVVSCPLGCLLGSMETFLGSRDVCTDGTVTGTAELLGVPLVGEAGGLCGELVQMVIVGVVFAGRETGKRVDVGTLCTLSPAVKMQRTKRILQTMVPWCLVPSTAQAAGEFAGTDRAHGALMVPPLPGGLRWEL